jgi:pyruvate,water dikinase
MNRDIVSLDDPDGVDPARVGAKAATLAQLRQAGEPVPDGVVVLPGADSTRAADAATKRLGGGPVAVRSSSQLEDLSTASYAGQYLTVLQVEGVEAIADAIDKVRGSAGAAVERGYGARKVGSMPVLVMPMVAATAAGVAFGANPITGDDEVVVDAVPGLGEALVSGNATPQRFICADAQSPSEQPGGGPPAIDPDQAARVATMVRRLGVTLGSPQDVEWAFVGDDLLVLQSRPITSLPVKPEMDLPGDRETWIRADENYAHPVRPLEFSVWAPRLEESFTKVFAEVGAPVDTMRYRSIGGWMYARFIPPMDQGKDDQPTPPAWLFGLLLRLIPPMRARLRRAAEVWRSGLGEQAMDAWEGGGRSELRARTRELRDIERASLDDVQLARHFDDVLDQLQSASDSHFRLPVLATFLPTGHLGVLAERLLGWGPERTLQLLQGYSTVTHAATALDDLAASVARDPTAVRLLTEDPRALLTAPVPAGDAIRTYLDSHGHRIVGMDLAHPTWAEDPAPVFAMLRARLASGLPTRLADTDVAAQAEMEARRMLANRPNELAMFEGALTVARRGISYGDDTEIDVLEAFALVRYVAREIARRFVERGLIARDDDIWFFDEDEIRSVLTGGSTTPGIERRRSEYLWAMAHQGPVRYGPEPSSWPSMRWAPKAARPFLEAMVWSTASMTGAPPDRIAPDGVLVGTSASPGRATGTVRVIRSPAEFNRIEPGDVLVCPCTVAAWSVVFPVISAIITEVGGPLSHPGILAREFGIPAVLAVPDATSTLRDGVTVTVDGTAGIVEMTSLAIN